MILPESTLCLTLSPDNPSNTTLVSQNGETLYTAVTENTKKAMFTQVRNARDELIASLEWRDVLSDKVTFGDKKPITMFEWMKRSLVPFKDDISFLDEEGRRYKWKGNSAGRSFELYSADDNYASTIARFHRSRRILPTQSNNTPPGASSASLTATLVNPITPGRTPAILELSPRAQQIQDLVVVSFLFLEKVHRTNEKEQQNRADALGSSMMSKNYVIHDGGV